MDRSAPARGPTGIRPLEVARNETSRRSPGGSSTCRAWTLRDRILGQVALHRGLAREVDTTLAVDLGHDDHDLVTDGDDILDGRDVVVGQLADANQALLAGQDLDERAEAHDPGDLAEIERADLDITGEALDPVDRLPGVLAGHGS